mmetsp:Transcript_51311/g.144559  ORF Transcript_51311/g.144559 Transcript_51311/m.144559 type:complete len:258 (-) Transcript_51311:1084-1857(-)
MKKRLQSPEVRSFANACPFSTTCRRARMTMYTRKRSSLPAKRADDWTPWKTVVSSFAETRSTKLSTSSGNAPRACHRLSLRSCQTTQTAEALMVTWRSFVRPSAVNSPMMEPALRTARVEPSLSAAASPCCTMNMVSPSSPSVMMNSPGRKSLTSRCPESLSRKPAEQPAKKSWTERSGTELVTSFSARPERRSWMTSKKRCISSGQCSSAVSRTTRWRMSAKQVLTTRIVVVLVAWSAQPRIDISPKTSPSLYVAT